MADRVISFKGEFDASSILASLKQIRSEMEKGGVDTSLFKGVDKDIAKAESMITEMLAQINKGFRDTKEITAFGKKISTLDGVLTKIGTGLGQINIPESFKKGTKEIQELTSKLEESKKNFEGLKQKALDFANQQAKSHKLSKDEADQIREAVNNEKDLYDVVKKINTEREKSSKQKLTSTYDSMSEGVQSTVKASFQSDKLDKKLQINSVGFSSDALSADSLKQYRAALLDIAKGEKTVEEAFKDFVKGLNDADKEVVEQDGFIKAYTEDLRTLAHTGLDQAVKNGILDAKDRTALKTNVTQGARGLAVAGASPVGMSLAPDLAEYNAGLQQTTQQTEELERKTEEFQNSVRATMASAASGIEDATNRSHQLNEAGQKNVDTMREEAAAQENLDKSFSHLQSIVKQVLSLSSAWRGLRQIITQTYQDVTKLDKAFAQIAMVTSYSVSDMWSQYSSYADMANKLGQSTESVIQASGLFYQQGLDTAEALSLTEDTMKLATLANLDFQESTSLMTAALRAFHMEMDQGSHITDVYAELAAHAAADVQGIAYAMSKTASISNSAGMSFENTSAFLAQMIETTQEAPENIGTAMKTIIARFTELKENVAGTADSEFDDLDYNKVDKALKSVGVSLKDATGQFRNLDDVFLELSAKWDTLDRNSQRYIATIAAGSRQQSRFIAMMENYDRTLELIETAQGSAGKSSEQFAKYQDTVEYKVNQLKNSWEALRISFTDSEFFGKVLDQLNNFVNKISSFNFSDFAQLGLVFLTVGKTAVQNIILGIKNSANGIQQALNTIMTKAMQSLNNKRTAKYKISPEVNRKDKKRVKEELNKLSEKKTIQLNIVTTNQEKIKSLQKENKKLESQVNAITKQYKGTGRAISELDQKTLHNLQEQIAANELNIETLTEAAETAQGEIEKLDNQARNLGGTPIDNSKLTSIFNAPEAGDAAAAAFSGAFTAAILAMKGTKSPGKAFATVLLGGLSSSLPLIQSAASSAFSAATAGGQSFAAALKAAGAAGGKVLLIALAIAAAMAIIVAIYKGVKKYQEDTLKESRETNDEAYKLQKQIKKQEKAQEALNKKLDEANEKYDEQKDKFDTIQEAAKTYEELKDKILLTEEEQNQYNESVNTLAEKMPDLVARWDAYGNAILKTGAAYDEVMEKQKQAMLLAEKEQAEAELAANLNEYSTIENKGKEADFKLKQFQQLSTSGELETLRAINFDNYVGDMTEWGNRWGQNYLKEVASGTNATVFREQATIAAASLGWGNNKTIEDIIDFIHSGHGDTEEEQLYNQLIDQIYSQVHDSSVLAEYEKAIGDAEKNNQEGYQKIHDSIMEVGKTALKLNGSTEKMSEESQQLLYGAIDNLAIDTSEIWERVQEETKDMDNAELKAEKQQELITQYFNEDEEIANMVEQYSQLTDHQTEIINDYYTNLSNLNKAEREEYLNKIRDSGVGDVVVAAAEAETAEVEQRITEYQNKVKELFYSGINFGEMQANNYTWDKTALLSFMEGMGEEASAKFVEALANGFDTDGEAAIFLQKLDQLLATGELELQDNELTYLLGIDWSNVTAANLNETKKAFEDYFIEQGHTLDEAKEAWDKYFQFIKDETNLIDLSVTGAGLEELQNNLEKKVKTSVSSFNSLSGVIEHQLTNGFISFTESQTVKKACEDLGLEMSDYIAYNDDGNMIFDAKAMKDAAVAQLQDEEQIAITLREQAQERINEIDAQLALIDGDEQSLELLATKINDTETLNAMLIKQGQIIAAINGTDYSGPTENEVLGHFTSSFTVDDSYRAALEAERDKLLDAIDNDYQAGSEWMQQYVNTALSGINEISTSYDDAVKKAKDATKKLEDTAEKAAQAETKAYREWQKAIDDVAEKQKALDEAIHGSDSWRSKADDMYNYTTNLERVQKAADDAKSSLDDLQDWDDAGEAMQKYIDNVHKEAAIGAAEARVYEQAIANGQKSLNEDMAKEIDKINTQRQAYADKMGYEYSPITAELSGLYKKVGDRYNIDFDKLNKLEIPDDFKDRIVEEIESWNKNLDEVDKIQEQKLKRQKEFNEMYKNALKHMVSLQEEMKNALKRKYEQEIEDVENKYQAMEDADNEYVDALEAAIQKQRDLRERENQWSDLADKERKLSLMQRDTSGGNLVETRQLEKEVQDDRQELLDNSIDDIIDGLKEMYELQKESRDAEIEYRKALIDEGLLMQEVTAALANIDTAEDLVAWFYENTTDLSSMSVEQIELEKMGWKDLFDAKTAYLEISQTDFNKALEVTEEDISEVVKNTSETLTTKAEDALNDVSNTVNSNIQSAQESLTSAIETLTEKEEAYTKAITANQTAQEAYNTALTNLDTMLEKLAEKYGEGETEKEPDTNPPPSTGGGSTSTKQTQEQKEIQSLNKQYEIASKDSSGQSVRQLEEEAASKGYVWDSSQHSFVAAQPEESDLIRRLATPLEQAALASYEESYGTVSNGIYIPYKPGNQLWQYGNYSWEKSKDGKNSIVNYGSLGLQWAGKNSQVTLEEWNENKAKTPTAYYGVEAYVKKNGKWYSTDVNPGKTATNMPSDAKKYATGGLVDFTGPAWVDGTKSRPEAFLSADDTKRIGEAAKLLSNLPLLDNASWEKNEVTNTNVGDTVIDIHINIENVSSDYDVDQAVDRVKQDIVDAANYAGSNVILRKH